MPILINGMLNYLISDDALYAQIGAAGAVAGIYKLRCLCWGNVYRHIPRLLRTDTEGVLYIGSAQDIRGRVMALRLALLAAAHVGDYNNIRAHPCGVKYNQIIQGVIPFASLVVTVHPLPPEHLDPIAGAYDLENQELLEYENAFGELPPCNAGLPIGRP